MSLLFALSPLLAVAGGALLLMLAEALGKPVALAGVNADGLVTDAGAGRAPELALGSSARTRLSQLDHEARSDALRRMRGRCALQTVAR